MMKWSRLVASLAAVNIWAAGFAAYGQISLTSVQNDFTTNASADDGNLPQVDPQSTSRTTAPDAHILSSSAFDNAVDADGVADLTMTAITTGAELSYSANLSSSAAANAALGGAGATASGDALLTSAVTFSTTIPVRFEFTGGSYQNSGSEPIATAVTLTIEQDTGSGFATIYTWPFSDAPTPQSFGGWVPGVFGPADYRVTAQTFADESATTGVFASGESNLSFTLAVPEPSAGLLAVVGLGLLARRRR